MPRDVAPATAAAALYALDAQGIRTDTVSSAVSALPRNASVWPSIPRLLSTRTPRSGSRRRKSHLWQAKPPRCPTLVQPYARLASQRGHFVASGVSDTSGDRVGGSVRPNWVAGPDRDDTRFAMRG